MPTTPSLVDIAVILNRLDNIDKNIDQINRKLDTSYITIDRYLPVERIVYGLVSVVLLTITGAILGLIFFVHK